MVTRTPTRSSATTRILTLAALLLAVAASSASAASPPVTDQATTADAAFLAYAPPPPNGAGALCLVDTGVNADADTTPGLVSATALDGGTGNDVDPLGHGTIDAATAGGSGQGGLIGAWPQLKIISIRSTNVPSAGQEPSFEFDDYWKSINACLQQSGPPLYAIDLPLASTIQPSPDETAAFAAAVSQAQAHGVTILAAAGNDSGGAIELPASEPGVFAVGAGQIAGNVIDPTPSGICSLSASVGLTFYAPGCGLDTINPQTDTPLCCGNGTSQASAFTSGVLVALRSYDPTLTAAKATQLLLSTVTNGHLDVAAAFRADGLSAIVNAGTAATPQPPPPAPTPAPSPAPAPAPSIPPPPASKPVAAVSVPKPVVKSATWKHGVTRIALRSIPAGSELHAEIKLAHGKAVYAATAHAVMSRHTSRPTSVLLHLTRGAASSATVTVKT
jgi:hypothetical protein